MAGRVQKVSLPPGFDHRTVQPVVTRYPGPHLLQIFSLELGKEREVSVECTCSQKAETFSELLLVRPSLWSQVRVIRRFKRSFLLNRFHWNAD